MTPFTHTVLAYVVVIALVWGYAAMLWLSARKYRTSTRGPGSDQEGDHP